MVYRFHGRTYPGRPEKCIGKSMNADIPEKPAIAYDGIAAKQTLTCAGSYLAKADQLIYSYGSRTFLSGYDIYDPEHENRGNIDCSTFVLLVLAGIPFKESPYATGTVEGLQEKRTRKNAEELVDFTDLPKEYIGIAERIGRPYLAGPRGLDLEKAESMGISLETLRKEIAKTTAGRRSVAIAEHYLQKDACFTDAVSARGGDLVFFCSKGFFREGERIFAANKEITHVGIVAEDPAYMINSSGTYQKDGEEKSRLPAVALAPIFGNRTPAFFARVTQEGE